MDGIYSNSVFLLILVSNLFYFLLVGYIFFWLTDYFEIVYGLSKILSMILFVSFNVFAIVLGLNLGGYVGDAFVFYFIQKLQVNINIKRP
jgi:hypothetical protein